jgi:hypothetical protein
MLIKAKPYQKDFFVLVNPFTINYVRPVVRIVEPEKMIARRDAMDINVRIEFAGRFELYADMRLNNGESVEALVATWSQGDARHTELCKMIGRGPSPQNNSTRAVFEAAQQSMQRMSQDIEISKEVEQWLQLQM